MYEIEKVNKKDAEEYAKSINGSFRCVSALSSNGINELFQNVGELLFKKEGKEATSEESSKPPDKEFSLKKDNIKAKKKKKFC